MPKTGPLVSFCVPTYRRAAFIAKTIESALAQTVSDVEVVVVDDCSPDNTAEVVMGISDDRLRYVRNTDNFGVPENLNRAMSLAKGAYLVLLEDHDLVEPTYVEETVKLMDRYPSIGFVATGLITIDERDNLRERYVGDMPEFMPGRKLLRRLLTRTDCPFSVTTVIRRSALIGLEPFFDPRYWWYADQHLWMRLSAKSDFGYVAQPLLRFRVREADHYLASRHWESRLRVKQIHQDNWHLLHSNSGFKSWWDSFLYEKAKFVDVAMFRAGQMMRNESWTEEDAGCCQSYASPFSCLFLGIIGMLPLGLVAKVRETYRVYHCRRTEIRDKNGDSFHAIGPGPR